MSAWEDKIEFIVRNGIIILAGLSGIFYTLYLAVREFQWGDDAGWGYVIMSIGIAMITFRTIYSVFRRKSRK